MVPESEIVELKVDVGVLKTQVATLTSLCNKMDQVIEKLMEKQDINTNNIYDDMNDKKQETQADIKELHSRITTVDRNLSDKLELTERRIMEEIKSLRDDIAEHNKVEDKQISKILEWKWMAAGGIVTLAWLVSHIKLDFISKIIG
jgi:chromosome segregation ATPase